MGMVTLGNIMSQILSGRITPESPIANCMYKSFKKVRIRLTLQAPLVMSINFLVISVHIQVMKI